MQTRAEKKAAKQAAWIAQGPALVERPLRQIKAMATSMTMDEKTGRPVQVISPVYYMARDAARMGAGDAVKEIYNIMKSQGN